MRLKVVRYDRDNKELIFEMTEAKPGQIELAVYELAPDLEPNEDPESRLWKVDIAGKSDTTLYNKTTGTWTVTFNGESDTSLNTFLASLRDHLKYYKDKNEDENEVESYFNEFCSSEPLSIDPASLDQSIQIIQPEENPQIVYETETKSEEYDTEGYDPPLSVAPVGSEAAIRALHIQQVKESLTKSIDILMTEYNLSKHIEKSIAPETDADVRAFNMIGDMQKFILHKLSLNHSRERLKYDLLYTFTRQGRAPINGQPNIKAIMDEIVFTRMKADIISDLISKAANLPDEDPKTKNARKKINEKIGDVDKAKTSKEIFSALNSITNSTARRILNQTDEEWKLRYKQEGVSYLSAKTSKEKPASVCQALSQTLDIPAIPARLTSSKSILGKLRMSTIIRSSTATIHESKPKMTTIDMTQYTESLVGMIDLPCDVEFKSVKKEDLNLANLVKDADKTRPILIEITNGEDKEYRILSYQNNAWQAMILIKTQLNSDEIAALDALHSESQTISEKMLKENGALFDILKKGHPFDKKEFHFKAKSNPIAGGEAYIYFGVAVNQSGQVLGDGEEIVIRIVNSHIKKSTENTDRMDMDREIKTSKLLLRTGDRILFSGNRMGYVMEKLPGDDFLKIWKNKYNSVLIHDEKQSNFPEMKIDQLVFTGKAIYWLEDGVTVSRSIAEVRKKMPSTLSTIFTMPSQEEALEMEQVTHKINGTKPPTPILIKHGNDFFVYGHLDGSIQKTKLKLTDDDLPIVNSSYFNSEGTINLVDTLLNDLDSPLKKIVQQGHNHSTRAESLITEYSKHSHQSVIDNTSTVSSFQNASSCRYGKGFNCNDFMNAEYSFLQRCQIAADLLEQLALLHKNNRSHGDINPANIKIYKDSNGIAHAKLFDFGASLELDEKGEKIDPKHQAGQIFFIAPEVLQFSHGKTNDMYSMAGIIGMLFSNPPNLFLNKKIDTENNMPTQISSGVKIETITKIPFDFNQMFLNFPGTFCTDIQRKQLGDFIEKMGAQKKEERPTSTEARYFFKMFTLLNDRNKSLNNLISEIEVINEIEEKITVLPQLKIELRQSCQIIIASAEDEMTKRAKLTEELNRFREFCFAPTSMISPIDLIKAYNNPQIDPIKWRAKMHQLASANMIPKQITHPRKVGSKELQNIYEASFNEIKAYNNTQPLKNLYTAVLNWAETALNYQVSKKSSTHSKREDIIRLLKELITSKGILTKNTAESFKHLIAAENTELLQKKSRVLEQFNHLSDMYNNKMTMDLSSKTATVSIRIR